MSTRSASLLILAVVVMPVAAQEQPKATYAELVATGAYDHPAGSVTAARPLVRVSPPYPEQMYKDRIDGWVDVEALVNPDGTVAAARPVAAKYRGVFDVYAINAMLKSRFSPCLLQEKPVGCKVLQRFEFKHPDPYVPKPKP